MINDDYKIPENSRTAAKISTTELWHLLVEAAKKCKDKWHMYDLTDDYEEYSDDKAYNVIGCLTAYDDIVNADNEFNIDNENIEPEWVGLKSTDDGIAFLAFGMGGDWELPSFCFLYYDGENIRMYIPRRGNGVNLDTMTAIGSEQDADENFDGDFEDYDEVREEYLAKYNCCEENIPNWSFAYDEFRKVVR